MGITFLRFSDQEGETHSSFGIFEGDARMEAFHSPIQKTIHILRLLECLRNCQKGIFGMSICTIMLQSPLTNNGGGSENVLPRTTGILLEVSHN
jgi:hypothetical protein